MGKRIKINIKRVEWSKKVVLFSLLLLVFSSMYRTVSEKRNEKRYEEELGSLIQVSRSAELQLALNSVSFENSNRSIHFESNYMYVNTKGFEEKKYYIEDLLYNYMTNSFTLVTSYTGVHNFGLTTFKIIPSDKKFESKVESLYGGLYNVVYSDADIAANRDPIFDILDIDHDGSIDLEFYRYAQEQAEQDGIYIDLGQYEKIVEEQED